MFMKTESLKGNSSVMKKEDPKLIRTKDCNGYCAVGLFCGHYIKFLQKEKLQELIKYMINELENHESRNLNDFYEGFADAIRVADSYIDKF